MGENVELLRDHRAWGGPVETFDPDEVAFYATSVAEGICPNLHEDDADHHDRAPRRLLPRAGVDGTWLGCESCGALWKLRQPLPNYFA